MREIKFRGKRKDNGKWVIGNLINNRYGDYAIESKITYDLYIVEKKTIGEYIGSKDKNGVEIWEGDIVERIHNGKKMQKCEVKFEDGSFGIDDYSVDGKMMLWGLRGRSHLFEVIGNIHQNPELLE